MTEPQHDQSPAESSAPTHSGYKLTWGPWLFRSAIALSLLFVWWLTIYPHGVAPH